MNRTILLTAAILAASLACADRAIALVGADLADRTIQRYTIAIGSAKGRCTGVVLAQNIVLTAAHCIVPGEKLWVGDSAGVAPQSIAPSRLSAVDEIVQHPLWSRKDVGSPDLAILKLATPLPDRFIPATLGSRHLAEGDNLIAAGYGKTSAEETKAAARAARGITASDARVSGLGDPDRHRRRPRRRRARRFRRAVVFLSRHAHAGGTDRQHLRQAHAGRGACRTLRLDQGDAGEADCKMSARRTGALTSPPPPPPLAA